MWASDIENGEVSPDFEVTNGTKQACGLAPLLFVIFFSMMLRVAFWDCNLGIPICYHTDGDLFDLRRLQAATKKSRLPSYATSSLPMTVAHTATALHTLFTQFINAAIHFGLTVNLKKTETMSQSYLQGHPRSLEMARIDRPKSCSLDPVPTWLKGKGSPYSIAEPLGC